MESEAVWEVFGVGEPFGPAPTLRTAGFLNEKSEKGGKARRAPGIHGAEFGRVAWEEIWAGTGFRAKFRGPFLNGGGNLEILTGRGSCLSIVIRLSKAAKTEKVAVWSRVSTKRLLGHRLGKR